MQGNGYNLEAEMGQVMFSFNNSDMSENSRLILSLLSIIDRFLRQKNFNKKRIYLFAGHALDDKSGSYNKKELVNFILKLGVRLLSYSNNTRVAFIPNLSTNDLTELALISSVDIHEALSESSQNDASILAEFESLSYMKCALNGAILVGSNSASNR